MSSGDALWVGYCSSGGRATLDLSGPGRRVLLLGSRANDLASLMAVASKEAGPRPLVLDLGGSLAGKLSGHLDTYDYRSFLYDSFRLEHPEPWHSQLVASAYAQTLDLSSEEESIINSVLQKAASEGSMASPVALYDFIAGVEGFRGFYVDKLRGRVGSLRLFDAVDDQKLSDIYPGGVIIDFHSAPYPQAAELATSLFIAKLLTISHSSPSPGGSLIITEAHRAFRASPRPVHPRRLLTHLMSWSSPLFFSSDQPQSMDEQLIDSCPVRVYSSDAWHSDPRREKVLPGSFVLLDTRTGGHLPFVPRLILSKTSEYVSARASTYAPPHLTSEILSLVERFPISTKESIAQYLSGEFLPSDVDSELTNLRARECLVLEPKETGSGPKVFAFTLSEKGRKLLQELNH